MTTFSKRHGYEPTQLPFQRERVDDNLRTKLWNVLSLGIWDLWQPVSEWHNRPKVAGEIEVLVRRLWIHFFNRDLDSLPKFKAYGTGAYDVLKKFFFECKWNHVYDFLEALAQDRSNLFTPSLRQWVNEVLIEHNAAYRLVEDRIVEITSDSEISAIQKAMAEGAEPVREHLRAALEMLSRREKPDYRNSIKESISAVESACRLATGMPKATLADALKKMNNLHPAMRQGFEKIYGYTSDADGVRHSLLEEAKNTYDEAKFMLVVCSAFVSYLKTS